MDEPTRHARIADRLATQERVEVGALAAELDTSEVTIRRDLEALADAGVLRRVRGGAVSLLMRGSERPFAVRELQDADAKRAIAHRAAALIADGEAVLVDSGTTCVRVAETLADRRVTAMALSLPAVQALAAGPAVEVVLPGGQLRRGERSFAGPLTERCVAALRFDTAVLSCCGITADGTITAHDLQDAAVKRTAIASASRVLLVAEAAKFAGAAMAVVATLADVDVLVTDADAPADRIDAIAAAGTEVLRA